MAGPGRSYIAAAGVARVAHNEAGASGGALSSAPRVVPWAAGWSCSAGVVATATAAARTVTWLVPLSLERVCSRATGARPPP
eukprot:scaffold1569_cov392-Prasinococcus_capsulatus_cf.AAC.1